MTVLEQTSFLDQIDSIPPLHAVAQRVLAVTESRDSSADDVARVLREDPMIAAKILRVANSPFYGARGQITQLSRAVTRLGTAAVRNLVLGICARNTFSANPMRMGEHEALWHHSLAVASACELIAAHLRCQSPEEAFVGGLLHDTGQLAMLALQPTLFRTAQRASSDGGSLLELEREHFGIDHAEAGFRIMSRWGLPKSICQVVLEHHREDGQLTEGLAVVILGDVFAHLAGYGLDRPHPHQQRLEAAARRLGLTEMDCIPLFLRLDQRVKEATEMLGDRQIRRPVSSLVAGLKEAVWLTAGGPVRPSLSRVQLERRGTQVRDATVAALGRDVLPSDVILADLQQAGGWFERMQEQGYRRLVPLFDATGQAAGRQRHLAAGGMARLPRLFTAFDFQWTMEQLLQ